MMSRLLMACALSLCWIAIAGAQTNSPANSPAAGHATPPDAFKLFSDKELAGRAHVYRPAVDEQRAQRSHLRDLLDRMFAGRPDEMVNGLIENERLTRADLEALRRRIDEKLGGGKPRGGH